MKISSALFAIILACNCFNSIYSATIASSTQVDLVVPRVNSSGVVADIQPPPENYTVSPDDPTTMPVTQPNPDTNVTTTPVPETTTSNATTPLPTPTPTPTPTTTTTTTTTEKPTTNPPKPDTTTTTAKPTTIPPKPDTTTEKPTPTTVTPVTPTPSPSPFVPPTPAPHKNRFDGPSFIGGIVLSLGLVAIAFVGWKYYKARTERNYRTL